MSLPLNYKPGMEIVHPRFTAMELLDGSGSAWGTVRMPERQDSVAISIAGPEGYLATISVHTAYETRRFRKPRPRRLGSRLQAALSIWVREDTERTWLVPGGTDDRMAVAARATFVASRDRVTVLDDRGAMRIIISADDPPAVEGERFRGILRSDDEILVYVVMIDGALAAGTTSQYLMP